MLVRILISFVLSGLLVSSCNFDECSSKRFYIASYDQFMKKIEKKQADFTPEEWADNDKKFERFSGDCYDKFFDEFSSSEKKKILKYNVKYVIFRVKSELPFSLSDKNEASVNDFIDNIDWDEIKGKGDELKEMWTKLDKTKFEEAGKEFSKAFEKLGKGLEEFGKELEKMLEESKDKKK